MGEPDWLSETNAEHTTKQDSIPSAKESSRFVGAVRGPGSAPTPAPSSGSKTISRRSLRKRQRVSYAEPLDVADGDIDGDVGGDASVDADADASFEVDDADCENASPGASRSPILENKPGKSSIQTTMSDTITSGSMETGSARGGASSGLGK